MQYNKLQEKLLTGPVLFICAMHISNTLIGTYLQIADTLVVWPVSLLFAGEHC